MSTAIEFARYVLWLAQQEPENESVTHLRLQKLLYYIQGWSLAKRGAPAFSGRLEAWTNGPVVKEVYPIFRHYQATPIAPSEASAGDSLASADRYFVRCVWEKYRQFSASYLCEKTHRERPWRDARQGCIGDQPSTEEITNDSLKRYFSEETRDSVEYSHAASPEWDACADKEFVDAAQAVLARHSELMRRLA